jgi:hypothetical protein
LEHEIEADFVTDDICSPIRGIEQAITDFDCHPLPHVSRRVNQRSKPMVIMA